MNGATYVEGSKNSKLNGSQKVDSTYASIEATCPKTCPFKGEGCYAQLGYTAITTHRLDDEAKGLSSIDVARAEAKAINESYKGKEVPVGRALRLHVAGDVRSKTAVRIIKKAIIKWQQRGGGKAWTYTHAWRTIPSYEWGPINILASVETVADANEAVNRGYVPAMVVQEHKSEKAYKVEGSDIKWIPCPQQTRGVGCSDCKLCMDTEGLYSRNSGIAFAAHGAATNKMKRKLPVLKLNETQL